MQVAKAVIGLVVVGHYPLNHHPARLAWEDLERQWLGYEEFSFTFSTIQSIIFIWTTVAVSVVVSSLFTISFLHSPASFFQSTEVTHISQPKKYKIGRFWNWQSPSLACALSSQLSSRWSQWFLKQREQTARFWLRSLLSTSLSAKLRMFDPIIGLIQSVLIPDSFEWTVWLTAMSCRILKVPRPQEYKSTSQARRGKIASIITKTHHIFHLQVKDLGSVLHMVGGTAAAYMIFCLPGLLLVNAAIVKHSNEVGSD